jgi:anti-sigma regulatory factor (Ser/Thr protein kinase)
VRVSQQRGEDNCNGRLDFPDGKLLLPTDLNEIPKLNAFVEEVCREVSFNPKTTGQIKMAVGEAVVNVMKYAYPPGQHGDVTIEAASNNLRLKFTIIDCGRPFDPTHTDGLRHPYTVRRRPHVV